VEHTGIMQPPWLTDEKREFGRIALVLAIIEAPLQTAFSRTSDIYGAWTPHVLIAF
jgi:hypothetical protein